ncbi:hypothetical protein [Natrarchaeobius chitinivorans]|nr:hypothetical protein [Natrarchaeobius chitinivorans]
MSKSTGRDGGENGRVVIDHHHRSAKPVSLRDVYLRSVLTVA